MAILTTMCEWTFASCSVQKLHGCELDIYKSCQLITVLVGFWSYATTIWRYTNVYIIIIIIIILNLRYAIGDRVTA